MPSGKGIIVLMGSGELTSTMVEVHKDLIRRYGPGANAVFLDTPAGFQLNADQLSQRATEYFRLNIGCQMNIASYRSKDVPDLEAEAAFRALREADLILVGPGSPTYAVRQWKGSSVPDIIVRRIMDGGCLIAASAAALTIGRVTMPVYEIYKVGEELHWAEGIDILGRFGFKIAVVPHWNNAEGGTHDTRCCFIGEPRFRELEGMLPEDTGVLGIDEHTACIIDLKTQRAEVRGIGTVTVRIRGSETVFSKGEQFPLEILLGAASGETAGKAISEGSSGHEVTPAGQDDFWQKVHTVQTAFTERLNNDPLSAANSVLELDRIIWKAMNDLENIDSITQARDTFREMIVLLGHRLSSLPKSREDCMAPLMEKLIVLRNDLRKNRKWQEADMIRDCLIRAGITLDDTTDGTNWKITTE